MVNLKAWFENFWMYNKWKVVTAVVALAILSVTLPTMINRKEPDFSIMYVGPLKVSASLTSDINKSTYDYIKQDYNGDGVISAEVVTLFLDSVIMPKRDESGNEIPDESMVYITYSDELYNQFLSEITVGDSVIYIVDPIFYEKLVDGKYLMSLTNVVDTLPENALDGGLGIPYASLKASNFEGFRALQNNMILCVRHKRSDESEEQYNQNISFLRDFISFK